MGEGTDLQVTGAGLLSGARGEEGSNHQDKHDCNKSQGTVTPASFRKPASRSPSVSQYDKCITGSVLLPPSVPHFLSHVYKGANTYILV